MLEVTSDEGGIVVVLEESFVVMVYLDNQADRYWCDGKILITSLCLMPDLTCLTTMLIETR